MFVASGDARVIGDEEGTGSHKMAATLFMDILANSVINNLGHSIWTGMIVKYRTSGGRIRILI